MTGPTFHDASWCREIWRALKVGGVWGVPRSGLTFTKRDDKLVLTEVMPHMPGMPGTEADLRAYQDEDYEAIKRHFETAGIPVERADSGGAEETENQVTRLT